MRGLLGLLSVVIGFFLLAVIMRFSVDHTHMVAAHRHPTHVKAVLAGHKVVEPATFSQVDVDGEFHGLKVLTVAHGSVAESRFGLQTGDVIIGVGPFDIGDSTLTNFDAARDWVTDAYQRSNVTLQVERDGEELSLPIGGGLSDMAVASGGADGSGDPSDKSPQITNPGGDE